MADWLEQRRIGETLRVLVDGDRALELHLRRDADPLPLGWTGEAIVRSHAGNRALVACGGDEAWLTGNPRLPVGSRLMVRVIRAPIAEPGALKRAHVVPAGEAPASDVPATARRVEYFDDSLLEQATSSLLPFGDLLLSLERCRAGLVIDIDGQGDLVDLSVRASAHIARQLRLYQVGGTVLIDYPSLNSKAQRAQVDAALADALAADPRPVERTAMNGFGLVQLVRPRPGPSLIDQLCGTRREGPSLETQMHALLWDAARSQGAGVRTLTAKPSLISRLEARRELMDELEQRIAAPVQLIADASAPGHGHVHVRPV
jgi:ribonuclease G